MSTSDMGSKKGKAAAKGGGGEPPPEVSELPVLVVKLEDFPPEVRGKAVARKEGRRAFGGESAEALTTLYDALPGVIARRLQRITPSDFRLSEIELELALDVALPGVEIGGTVKVTLKPVGDKPGGHES